MGKLAIGPEDIAYSAVSSTLRKTENGIVCHSIHHDSEDHEHAQCIRGILLHDVIMSIWRFQRHYDSCKHVVPMGCRCGAGDDDHLRRKGSGKTVLIQQFRSTLGKTENGIVCPSIPSIQPL